MTQRCLPAWLTRCFRGTNSWVANSTRLSTGPDQAVGVCCKAGIPPVPIQKKLTRFCTGKSRRPAAPGALKGFTTAATLQVGANETPFALLVDVEKMSREKATRQLLPRQSTATVFW